MPEDRETAGLQAVQGPPPTPLTSGDTSNRSSLQTKTTTGFSRGHEGSGCQLPSPLAPRKAPGIALSRYQIWGVSPLPHISSSAGTVPLPKETQTFRLGFPYKAGFRACSLLCSAKPGVTLRLGCRGKPGGAAPPGWRAQSWLCKQHLSLQLCPFLFSPFSIYNKRIFSNFPAILNSPCSEAAILMPQNAKLEAKCFLGVEKPPALKPPACSAANSAHHLSKGSREVTVP